MAEIRNYTMNFGPQHPAADGIHFAALCELFLRKDQFLLRLSAHQDVVDEEQNDDDE